MKMESIKCSIKGISPLLMHKFPLVPIEGFDKLPVEEQVESVAYRTEKKELFIPGVNIQRALVNGGVFLKGKGRASLQKVVAACVMVTPEVVKIFDPANEKVVLKDYTIDSRRVVIKSTGGAIVRHRPRLDEWQVSFTIDYDATLLSEKQLREVVDATGCRVGLLDFRPEKKGPFGRFMVVDWKKV